MDPYEKWSELMGWLVWEIWDEKPKNDPNPARTAALQEVLERMRELNKTAIT